MLLALLGAWLLWRSLGTPLRTRLVALLALIAVYVPVAGAGPSIQRAGIMGAAGVVAAARRAAPVALVCACCSRPRSTLALNPRRDRRRRLAAQLRRRDRDPAVRGPDCRDLILGGGPTDRIHHRLAGAPSPRAPGVTIAATLATAPLIAHALRRGIDRGAAREPAGAAGRRADDVAGDARRHRRAGARRSPSSHSPRSPGSSPPTSRRSRTGSARPTGRSWSITLPAWPQVVGGVRRSWRGDVDRGRVGTPRGGDSVMARTAEPAWRPWRSWLAPRWRSDRRPEPPYRRPGFGSSSWTSARATRSCSIPTTAGRCWWTAVRRETTCAASSSEEGVDGLAAAIATHDQSDHVGGLDELLGIRGSRSTGCCTASQGPTSSAPRGP